ncbi:hypothetical protein EVAR_22477_1 [Eumeta japonica]|uniref:Uncharacterized protein n=1 Tax=Eumeta variegata TaxID=151549 RepID=A0A4C1VFB0_EUMVA|nr:hypothetical protein EVAR_22477_1 [Eumeta japonica]
MNLENRSGLKISSSNVNSKELNFQILGPQITEIGCGGCVIPEKWNCEKKKSRSEKSQCGQDLKVAYETQFRIKLVHVIGIAAVPGSNRDRDGDRD